MSVLLHKKATAVTAPPDEFEVSRSEKLRRIETLGLDPWGGRFDNHQAIAAVRALPNDLVDDQRPKVRVAGRIKLDPWAKSTSSPSWTGPAKSRS